MSTWSVIRDATQEDKDKLETRAAKFAKRHDIEIPDPGEGIRIVNVVESYIDDEIDFDPGTHYGQYLNGLWMAVVRRALGSNLAEGIAWDTVGFTVE